MQQLDLIQVLMQLQIKSNWLNLTHLTQVKVDVKSCSLFDLICDAPQIKTMVDESKDRIPEHWIDVESTSIEI